MKKISIQDIARELNISTTTVSLVLNGKAEKYKISKETQKKIHDYAAKINYFPNAHARGLSSGKSYVVGYLVPDIANPFFARVGRRIEDMLAEEGYQMMSASFDENPQKERNIIYNLLSRQVDGLIVASSGMANDTLDHILKTNTPLVLFDREIPEINANYVGIDNKQSAYNAISEFIARGHKDIAIITLTPEIITIKERMNGYFQALDEAGIKTDQSLIIHANTKDLKNSIHSGLKKVLKKYPDLKAIFFINNLCALNGLWVINHFFKEIKEKMSLLSFDDIEFFEFSTPLVSGIAQPRNMIAENCAQLLLSKIRNSEDTPHNIILKTKINWR